MGSAISGLGDNQEVRNQSGCSRLLNSIVCALCVAPILMIAACWTLGWNERRAVCDARAIAEGKEVVEQVGCGSKWSGDGELVMFSCDLSTDGLAPLSPESSDFESSVSFVGVGLTSVVEVFQCQEHEHSETKKDSVGGGTTTVVTYTYSTDWSSSYIDSASFSSTGKSSSNYMSKCGVENPTWPSYLPTPGSQWNPSAKVGAFTIPSELVRQISLDAPVLASTTPSGWTYANGYYQSTIPGYQFQSNGIGRARVRFYGNDWSMPTYTVLGRNEAGTVDRWTASDSWLCSGFTLIDLRTGTVSIDRLFSALEAESNATTHILRFLGFLLLWFAFSRLFGPLEVAADCIPCVGPCLGDSIATIACCVSCLPGCACALGVIGVVWVAMRPMVGIPLVLIFLCTCCGFVGFKIYSEQKKSKTQPGGTDSSVDGGGAGGEDVEAS
mmetsp:Transcript_756/g.1584  ORF Transcript_756/g.1584 Transcript_756/m.1584 type:complete len:441 (+) Transcript_756:59-1381(+)